MIVSRRNDLYLKVAGEGVVYYIEMILDEPNISYKGTIPNYLMKKISKKNVLDFFGVLKDKDWSYTKKHMKMLRDSFEERLFERQKNHRKP